MSFQVNTSTSNHNLNNRVNFFVNPKIIPPVGTETQPTNYTFAQYDSPLESGHSGSNQYRGERIGISNTIAVA